jgi:AcrR family transcriptional regulator
MHDRLDDRRVPAARRNPCNPRNQHPPTRRPPEGISVAPERASSLQTQRDLLEAAASCLGEAGYSALSTRSVAERAGVPVSQIHYHFGGKDGLLLRVLAFQNEQLLERQQAMYGASQPLWRRWEQACDYLEEDLASGYVRVLHELIAVGWSDPTVADQVGEQLERWAEMLTSVAEEATETLGVLGVSPRHVAVLVGCVFLGAEQLELLGLGDRIEAVDALRAVGELIRRGEEGG